MIGIANEMLLYFSYASTEFRKICSTNTTLTRVRSRLGRDSYSEEQMAEWLTTLKCERIRPRVVVPAIIVDRNKRVFDEHTFVQCYMSPFVEEELKRKLNLKNLYAHGYLNPRAMKIFLKKKKAYVLHPRTTLPSVWSYEPNIVLSTSPQIQQTIGRIIGNQLHQM